VRALAGTPAYKQSQRARYKVEALFAELKQQMCLRRVRLRRTWNVAEQFHRNAHDRLCSPVFSTPSDDFEPLNA